MYLSGNLSNIELYSYNWFIYMQLNKLILQVHKSFFLMKHQIYIH